MIRFNGEQIQEQDPDFDTCLYFADDQPDGSCSSIMASDFWQTTSGIFVDPREGGASWEWIDWAGEVETDHKVRLKKRNSPGAAEVENASVSGQGRCVGPHRRPIIYHHADPPDMTVWALYMNDSDVWDSFNNATVWPSTVSLKFLFAAATFSSPVTR